MEIQLQINHSFNPLKEKSKYNFIREKLLSEGWIENKYHIVSFTKNKKPNLIKTSFIRKLDYIKND